MERINSGSPFLLGHDMEKQIGVVEKAWMDNGKGRAIVRFSRSALGEEIYNDVKDGIRRLVSVGYMVHNMKLIEQKQEGPDAYRVDDWEPYEVSIVPVPADITVGVGKSLTKNEDQIETKNQNQKEKIMPTETQTPAPVIEAKNEKDFRKEAGEILAYGKRFNMTDDAHEAIQNGKTLVEFKELVWEKTPKHQAVKDADTIGMTPKETKTYSLVKAINDITNGRGLSGLEKEASDATAKLLGRSPQGFFVPGDVAFRDMNATVDADKGQATIQTAVMGSSFIELLRNRLVLNELGIRTMSGLRDNVSIPKQTAAGSASWLAEGASSSISDATIGDVPLAPHRLAGERAYTKQLLAQSTMDIDSFVREDLLSVLAIAIDAAGIQGAGSAEPTGVVNTAGVNSVTFGAAPTWAKIVEFEEKCETGNALFGNLSYLTTPAVAAKLKTVLKASGTSATFLMGDDGMVNGYRTLRTNQVSNNKVIFGNWDQLILALWAGIDIVVDPYTLASAGKVRIVINQHADFGVRQAKAFTVSSDAGNQ
jgi:HK97 family phage major capsid protein